MKSGFKNPTDRTVFVLFLVIAGLYGTPYWLLSLFYWPDAPFSTIALYRVGGDIELWPLITRSWDSGFGDVTIYEKFGKDLITFPYIPLLPYMVCYHLFGDAGFVVADMAVSAFRFYALYLVVRFFISKQRGALIIAFLLFNALYIFSPHPFRIHRYYVTMAFFLMAVYSLLKVNGELLHDDRLSARTGAMHGANCALLLQGDLYGALVMLLATFFIAFYDLVKRNRIRKAWFVSGGVFILLSCAFIIQYFHRFPEITERWSAFKPDILVLPFVPPLLPISALLCFFMYGVVRNSKESDIKQLEIVLITLGTLVVAAMAFSPLYLSFVRFSLVYGDEHDTEALISEVAMLLFASVMLYFAVSRIPPRRTIFRDMLCALFIISATRLILALAIYHDSWAQRDSPPQAWSYGGYGGPVSGYREEFITLVKELENPRYDKCVVMGTLDFGLEQWWVAFRKGYSYLAFPGLSLVSDHEIERRLFSFANLIGVPSGEFMDLLNQRIFHFRFYTGVKYLASRYYLRDAPENYSREQLAAAWGSRDIWNIIIPDKENERIRKEYSKGAPLAGRLDVIVIPYILLPGVDYALPDGFDKTFENKGFVVWKKRGC